jgi:hypothetical protein
MSTVDRDFKRRLARMETPASAMRSADRQAASHRGTLRVRVKTCKIIRERFLLMGLDPALAVSLQLGEDAPTGLAALPDSEALRTADEAITRSDLDDCAGATSRVKAKIELMAVDILEGSQLDFAKASVVQLLAFCVAIEKLGWGDRYRPSAQQADLPDG